MRNLLESVYREHRQGLFSLALSILRAPERAEDAVHEGFCRLLRKTQRPQGDPVAYVFAAVRNAAIDLARSTPRPAVALDEALFCESAPADPLTLLQAQEQQQQLRRALGLLDPDDAQVVVLRVVAGLSFAQMAQTLGQPLPTVASRYRRALEKLRQFLQDVPLPERLEA